MLYADGFNPAVIGNIWIAASPCAACFLLNSRVRVSSISPCGFEHVFE